MELLLIRHGRPESQLATPGDGADPPLTARGRAEADLLGRYLAREHGVEIVYSSPMTRARETAEAIRDHARVPLHLEDRLREFDHGAASYTPPELNTAPDEVKRMMWRALETGVWGDHTFNPDVFEQRVSEAFDAIIVANASSTVAVVCHSGVLNSFLGTVLGRPRGMFFQPDYTSVSRVIASGRRRQLLTLNETTHLKFAEGEAILAAPTKGTDVEH
ncbi:histidine phosphatase family protein [Amycolatopsis thermoflava]|uniref:histidine phosphatase family protein n=1 Tax=Amycolatopsis thermoflava TaxID=84480 RepID=UPI003662ACC2